MEMSIASALQVSDVLNGMIARNILSVPVLTHHSTKV
jgi:hypothetical protein